jgi:hypothetical protein
VMMTSSGVRADDFFAFFDSFRTEPEDFRGFIYWIVASKGSRRFER